MGNYLLQGKIVKIEKAGVIDGANIYTVILTGDQHINVNGDTLLRATEKVSGAIRKGGSFEVRANTTLVGKKFSLIIE